jgi:hypothetical protein
VLTKDQRAEWVRRGFKDPHRAYAQHAAGAAVRGIEFQLTFSEWWGYWQDHYERRGREKGCMVMCRTGDKGPYAVGNVRIATVSENHAEKVLEYLTKYGRKEPSYRQITPPAATSWLWRRDVFSEYKEEEENA